MSLFAAKRVEGDAALKTEMVIRFVFAGVKDDGGDWTGPEGVEWPVIWRSDEARHFEGIRAANVVIPERHEQGALSRDVSFSRVEQGGNEQVGRFPIVAGIAIPEEEIGRRSDLIEFLNGFIIDVRIVPNDEFGFGGGAIQSAERFPIADFFATARSCGRDGAKAIIRAGF